MARFPLPVIRPHENAQETYTAQEQLEAQFYVDEARHEELKAQNERMLKQEEERKQREKKQEAERLKAQKLLFNDSLRTGLFGKLEFAFKQRDKLIGNMADAIKDSLSDRIFGKSIADKESEEEGMVRTTLVERVLTNQKYKDVIKPEDLEEKQDEPVIKEPKKPKVPKTPVEEPPEEEPAPPKKKRKYTRRKPKSEDSSVPEVVPLSVKDVVIERDLDSEKNQLPLFKKISTTLTKIGTSLTKYFKDKKALDEASRREQTTNELLAKTEGTSSFLGEEKVDSKGFSFPLLVGASALLTTITATVLGAIKAVGMLIVKALPVAALAGGLYLAVKDGIAGWFSAEKWGVSNLSGMVGGLLGGLDSGVMGALKNGGKWALIGAGIGSVVPVVGTLLGGLVGAGFGAILGYFGGEAIAKFLDGIVSFLSTKWNEVTNWFNNTVDSIFASIDQTFTDLKDWVTSFSFEDIKKTFKDSMNSMYESAKEWVKNLFTYDYWFGDEKGPTQTKSLEVIRPDGSREQVDVELQRKPLEINVDPGNGLKNLTESFDKFIEKSSPIARAREIAVERLVEQTIESSTVNNSHTNNADYSRVNNTVMTSNSNNRANVNIMGIPGVRNGESSAFGTRSSIHGGLGNFSRY